MYAITILIADDDKEIANLVELHLAKEGYHCMKVSDGQKAIEAVRSYRIDLVILDIMMPEIDGYEVTRQIREQHFMPIIFLSAKASDLDKIAGFVRGADDYVTKPFNPMKLVARVNAHIRRSKQFYQASKETLSIVEAGGIIIHPEERAVLLYGQPIELTPKEFDILYLLMRYPKKVFSTENIFQQVWGEEYYEGSNTVMVHISHPSQKAWR